MRVLSLLARTIGNSRITARAYIYIRVVGRSDKVAMARCRWDARDVKYHPLLVILQRRRVGIFRSPCMSDSVWIWICKCGHAHCDERKKSTLPDGRTLVSRFTIPVARRFRYIYVRGHDRWIPRPFHASLWSIDNFYIRSLRCFNTLGSPFLSSKLSDYL